MSSSEFAKGIEKFRRKLQTIGDRAEALDGSRVSFADLFTPEFMSRHTTHETFEGMISVGGFSVESADDFLAIPDDEWDRHVAATTDFGDWAEMQSKAGTKWAVSQLRI